MRSELFIFCMTIVLAFIVYKPGMVLPVMASTAHHEEPPANSDTQEENETKRQLEEHILPSEGVLTLWADQYTASYFLKNSRIPHALPIPLHEPPPNSRC